MLTANQYNQYLLSKDAGLLLLVCMVAVCVTAGILLYNRFKPGSSGFPTAAPIRLKPPTLLVQMIDRYGVFMILLLGYWLRLPKLFESFWYDEAFTARIAALSLPELPRAVITDVHPPFYYSIMWLWSRFGGSDPFLRLPSLAFGILTIYLIYRLVIALGRDERIALIAALLCAASPAAIYYSTEMRPYALLAMSAVGALVALVENRRGWFILFVAFTGWSHWIGVVYAGVLCMVALFYYSPRRWLISAAVGGGLACLFLPLALYQTKTIVDGYWYHWNLGYALQPLTLNILYVPVGLILPVAGGFLALMLIAFYAARRWALRGNGWLLFAVILLPPIIVGLISTVWKPIFVSRAFMPSVLLALIPLAILLHKPSKLIRVAGALVLIPPLVIIVFNPIGRPEINVPEGCAGANAVYYTDTETAFSVGRYWSGPALVLPSAQDYNQVVTADDLTYYGFTLGLIQQFAGLKVCVPYSDTPYTDRGAVSLLTALRMSYPYIEYRLPIRSYHDLVYYVFDL